MTTLAAFRSRGHNVSSTAAQAMKKKADAKKALKKAQKQAQKQAEKLSQKQAAARVAATSTGVAVEPAPRGMRLLEGGIFLAVILLFFASGFSSLIYQVVWTRMLVLVFGATEFATSTVLSVFMGGLAVGSFVAGRFSDKIKRPLLWYGILEAIIGVWALLTPALFSAATPLYKLIWQYTHASTIPFSLLRFVCTSLILILPTTCMGATLPLLARFVTTALDKVGSRVGTLYAVNTFGAVIGAAVTGFALLPEIGLTATIYTGAAINILLLLGVLLINATSKSTAYTPESESKTDVGAAPAPAEKREPLPRPIVIALVTFAISGAIAMAYEVCWTRALLMVIGSSTYAFTVMLCAFLVGIFGGSLVCSRFIDRSPRPLFWFAVFQMMIGALTLLSMRNFNFVPYWNLSVGSQMSFDQDALMIARFMIAGSMLAPVTFFLGAIFPAVVKGCTSDLSRVGRSVGSLYSANTLGAIIGAFLAGFVCLPLFGAERTLYGGALLNAALGVVLLWTAAETTQKTKLFATASAVFVVVGLACTVGFWDHAVLLNVQAMRRAIGGKEFNVQKYGDWLAKLRTNCEVKYWHDGACANVGVTHYKNENVTSLITNGHIDASDDVDAPVQALISGIPLLIKPDVKDMAIVGWGCGQTVGIATLFPVKNIDAIELEPSVIEASKFFHHFNLQPEKDPRVHLIFNDGRNYLLATDKKYDLIVSEPSNPWRSGVCNLFTKEYFEVCKDRLVDDGMMAIWLQVSEVKPTEVCAVLNSINAVFDHSVLFYPHPGNTVILASRKPINLDEPTIARLLRDPARAREFKRVGLENAEAMLSHFIVATDGMHSVVASSKLRNTDDQNRLEFQVGKSYESQLFLKANNAMLIAIGGNPWNQVTWGSLSPEQKSINMTVIAEDDLRWQNKNLALGWAERAVALHPSGVSCKLLGTLYMDRHEYAKADEQLAKALQFEPNNPDILVLRGSVHVAMNKRDLARSEFTKVLAVKPQDKTVHYLMALSYQPLLVGDALTPDEIKAGEGKTAKTVLAELGTLPDDAEFVKDRPAVLLLAAMAHHKMGDTAVARKYADAYLKINPDSLPAKKVFEAQ